MTAVEPALPLSRLFCIIEHPCCPCGRADPDHRDCGCWRLCDLEHAGTKYFALQRPLYLLRAAHLTAC